MVTSVRSQLLLMPAPRLAVMPLPRLLSVGFGGDACSAPPIRPQCMPRSPRRYQPLLESMNEVRYCGWGGGSGYPGISAACASADESANAELEIANVLKYALQPMTRIPRYAYSGRRSAYRSF